MFIREKKHRLHRDFYQGPCVVVFTICIKDKKSFFTAQTIFECFQNILLDELHRFDSSAEVYLFMPDHCHLLLRGNDGSSDLLKAIKSFKQNSGFWLSKNHPDVHWQKGFYDHILRSDEDLIKQIRYILNNPVRKGIVEDWKMYPLKGSSIYNFDEW